jgi:hypothetical protein
MSVNTLHKDDDDDDDPHMHPSRASYCITAITKLPRINVSSY